MLDYLLNQWYLFILLILILAILDPYLTVAGLKAHQKYAAPYIRYQYGYELNPAFEKQIAGHRWISWKHLSLVSVMVAWLILIWLMVGGGGLFEFLAGGILLLYVSVNLRHLQNILIFRALGHPDAVQGHIEYAYWLSQRTSAYLFLSEAILFAVAGALIPRPFFWGGVFFCMLYFVKSMRLANRKFPEKVALAEQEQDAQVNSSSI